MRVQSRESINGAFLFWDEAMAFRDSCRRAWPGKGIFTPGIMYQLSALCIEKMFMAWMSLEGRLPDNHTLRDLVRAAERIEALPLPLRHSLLRMDRFMDLCPMVPTMRPEPTRSDIPEFLANIEAALAWLGPRVERFSPDVCPDTDGSRSGTSASAVP